MRTNLLVAAAIVVAVARSAAADPISFCGQSFDETTVKIECEDKSVRDLAPLAGATALESLYVVAPVSDVSPLAGLTRLRKLDLRLSNVSDLRPLATVTSLRELELRGTPVSDLKPLAKLQLAELWLSGTKVTDLTPIAKMVTLTQIDVSDTGVKKIRMLGKLKALDQVDLRSTKVSRADAQWLGKIAQHVYWGADGEGHFGKAVRH